MSIEFGEVNKYDRSSQFPVVDLVFTGPKRSLVDRVSGNAAQFTRNTIGTYVCLLYTSPSPRDRTRSRMPSSA